MKTFFFIIPFFLSVLDTPHFKLIPDTALSAIEIQWSFLDASIAEYHVYRSESGGAWSLYQIIYGDENSFVDWNIKGAYSYRYCIWAKYKDDRFSIYSPPMQVVWE